MRAVWGVDPIGMAHKLEDMDGCGENGQLVSSFSCVKCSPEHSLEGNLDCLTEV